MLLIHIAAAKRPKKAKTRRYLMLEEENFLDLGIKLWVNL
jgi:hypothetical protein